MPPDWARIKDDLCGTIAQLDEDDQAYLVGPLPKTYKRNLRERWHWWAHEGQQAEEEAGWRVWMILAGRGFGKTLAGAEWVSELARSDGNLRIALVGATYDDVRTVMVEGESGLLAVAHVGENPLWFADKGELHFTSGAIAYAYSAESFEKLRGPQHHHAWCDELGKWRHAKACWDNLLLGMRLGEASRILVTTTPRPTSLMRRLVARNDVLITRGRTHDNENLPDDYLAHVESLYAGTRLGRQELDGELLEDHAGALWTRDLIESRRVALPPEMARVVVAVDPPASAEGDACGIVVAGLGKNGLYYLLADCSVSGQSPEGWARAVAAAAWGWNADRVIAEANQGGDMVASTLRAASVDMPVTKVHARSSKSARAEPVLALYEGGRAFHVGSFPDLEDQLCGMIIGGGYEGPGRSPDRADALVWAMTELMDGQSKAVPKITIL